MIHALQPCGHCNRNNSLQAAKPDVGGIEFHNRYSKEVAKANEGISVSAHARCLAIPSIVAAWSSKRTSKTDVPPPPAVNHLPVRLGFRVRILFQVLLETGRVYFMVVSNIEFILRRDVYTLLNIPPFLHSYMAPTTRNLVSTTYNSRNPTKQLR